MDAKGQMGPWFVYVLCEQGSQTNGPCKIGTAKNVKYRVDGMRGGNWRHLVICKTFRFENRATAMAAERAVLAEFTAFRHGVRDWMGLEPAYVIAFLEDQFSEDTNGQD